MMEQANMFEQDNEQPLAARMRPRDLTEFVGQQHLLGPGKILRRLIEEDRITSMIFWGPPGVGKTTLARIIASRTQASFADFSAVTGGIKEARAVMERAEEGRRFGERTILFVDEIHRFNKAQQDAFLPFVERGSIILIGATTENPSFEVNGALLSRCRVFVLRQLTEEDITGIIERAIKDPRGFGNEDINITPDMVDVKITAKEGFAVAMENNVFTILDTTITPELESEGLARELISKVQQMRKQNDYEMMDNINIYVDADDDIKAAIEAHKDYIMKETLAVSISEKEGLDTVNLNGHKTGLDIERV